MLQPVAKAAFTDGFRDPVDRLVVRDELVLYGRHLDEPLRTCIVQERRVAAPAMRIAMRELRCLEQLAMRLEVFENHRVGFLDEDTAPLRLIRKLALAVDEVDESDVVFLADAIIVFTKGRSHMDDARAVFRRDIAIADHDKGLFIRLFRYRCIRERIERLIFTILEFLALAAGHDLALALDPLEDFVHERLSENVVLATHRDLDVVHIRIHAEREVRGQRPRRRRPCKIVSIVLILGLERDHGGALRHILIALRHLMRGKRRAAARAVGHDLVALVEQALIPDLLQCPPLGLDEVVLIGNIGMVHVSPETDDIGELLPHSLVLPHGLTTLFDEWLNAVFLNLLLAIDADGLLDLQLHRQAVRIPAGLAQDLLALH